MDGRIHLLCIRARATFNRTFLLYTHASRPIRLPHRLWKLQQLNADRNARGDTEQD